MASGIAKQKESVQVSKYSERWRELEQRDKKMIDREADTERQSRNVDE